MADLLPFSKDKKKAESPEHTPKEFTGTYSYDEAEEIFVEACRGVRGHLSEDKKSGFQEFRDSKSMIESVKEECSHHRVNKSRLTQCCRQISKLSEKLEPFFDIVNIFIQSHPELASLAWGVIRLIFQV